MSVLQRGSIAARRRLASRPEVTDSWETARKDMLEKPPQELLMGEGHDAALAVMSIIFSIETTRECRSPRPDDGWRRRRDGCSGQIVQDVLRPAERLFRVDHPVFAEQRTQECGEGLVLHQRQAGPKEDKLVLPVSAFQPRHELSTKYAAQYPDWQEEAIGRANPLVVIRRESPAGHDAVNVGMRLQRLPPGMQDAQESDLRAEVFRIGGDFQQGRCAGVEQELEEHFLVLPDEGNQRMWHAEDQMVIVDRR